MKKFYTLLFFIAVSVCSFGQSTNDACAGASLVLDNGSCNAGSILAADADNLTGTAGCATTGVGNQHKDVWYRFVASNGGISYNITSTMATTEFVVLSSTGACVGLGLVGSGCGASPLTGVVGGLVPGNTYYIIISAPSNATGNFTMCLTTIPPPANDVKCGAVALTPNGASVCATNAGGTSTGDGTGSCFTTENGLWYKVTVATVPSVLAATADFAGTNFDAQIAIFSSSNNLCSGVFTELACDDNSGSGTNPVATTPITAVGTYFILIDGYAGATGNFCIAATLQTCSDGVQNQNESGVDCGGSCPACVGVTGYLQPPNGLQGAYVGECMVNTCSGNFFDSGGSAADYAPNSVGYRTFCPSTAGQCMKVTFSSFNVATNMGAFQNDYLQIKSGPTQTSPTIATINGAGIPGPYTSTDKSGCLTFWFFSDASVQAPGWQSVLSCVPCATAAPTSGGPNGTDNNDCSTAVVVCANTSLTGASTGPGLTSDGCAGCNVSENFASWYKIIVTASGTMGMVISPNTLTNDYDFALYQASSCSSLGVPVRCSYAASTGTTGMLASATDVSEDVTGNGNVDTMRITAGDVYYLLVNKWDAGGSGFSIDWGLSNGASIACPTLLPIELLNFDAVYNGKEVEVKWATASEVNNDYFIVERSEDGVTFNKIGVVDSKGDNGNSTSGLRYTLNDPNVKTGVYYYRLKQVDFDLTTKMSEVVAVNIVNDDDVFSVRPNPTLNSAEVSYYCYSTENALLRVYDNTGKLVTEKEISCSKGQNKSSVNLDSEAAGLYVVTLTTGNKVYKTKLVKQSN